MIRGDGSAWGPGLELDAAYDVSDSWQLRGTLAGSAHALCPSAVAGCERPTLRAAGSVGPLYRLDVIEWVPYGGPMIGYRWLGGGTVPESGAHHAGTIGWLIGVDYLLSRSTAIGAAARYDGDWVPSRGGLWETRHFNLALRFERRWGL